VIELNAKIQTDSTNSSKAPSSDMAKKKSTLFIDTQAHDKNWYIILFFSPF
jgi:uncharacterized protein DUF6444